jgi:hypothetical protein
MAIICASIALIGCIRVVRFGQDDDHSHFSDDLEEPDKKHSGDHSPAGSHDSGDSLGHAKEFGGAREREHVGTYHTGNTRPPSRDIVTPLPADTRQRSTAMDASKIQQMHHAATALKEHKEKGKDSAPAHHAAHPHLKKHHSNKVCEQVFGDDFKASKCSVYRCHWCCSTWLLPTMKKRTN